MDSQALPITIDDDGQVVTTEEVLARKPHGVNFTDVEREQRMALFLAAYAQSLGNVSEACERAKISRWLYRYWRLTYPQFADDLEIAKLRARDFLREEATARGTGDNPSDRVLIKLMEAHLPEHRPTRYLEVSGPGGGPVQLDVLLQQYVLVEKRFILPEELAWLTTLATRIEERKQEV